MAVIIGLAIGLAIATLIHFFFFRTIQRALLQCAPQNQKMVPINAFLGLIPVFNYYWNFRVVNAVADSLAAEYQMRGMHRTEERPGAQVGMAFAILYCGGLIQYAGIPVIGQLCGLAGFICWIVYWVRIARFKRELEDHRYQFGQGNVNVYPFPNQFPGQQQYSNQGQNPYVNQQQNPYFNQPQNPNNNPAQNPNEPWNPGPPNQ